MRIKRYLAVFIVIMGSFYTAYGQVQDVTLYQQFNGRYDFTFIGNTMNLGENNITVGCADLVQSTSSAELSLNPNAQIEKAYLYWAGSGDVVSNVTLNGIAITAERDFSVTSDDELNYFSAFAEVTHQLLISGNGTYTLSDLDISPTLNTNPGYCQNRTNFAGWAILIIYSDTTLPINQINVYDGLQKVPDDLVINLNSLNVLDTNNSKIGFIAWEGDVNLATEDFEFNDIELSNALNPADNVFNGTNSITGSNQLYNMDLDIYDIQNYIHIGDATATIKLHSDGDYIMINAVVTKLNNQLPDATIAVDPITTACDSRTFVAHYTVSNLNSTNTLPANTPIAIYANNQLIAATVTAVAIPIDGSWSSQITLQIPTTIPQDFVLKFVVDDTGTGQGIVTELLENNNSYSQLVTLWTSPLFNVVPPQYVCVTDVNNHVIDLNPYAAAIATNTTDTVTFFTTQNDAIANSNPISNMGSFVLTGPNTTLFIRIDNQHCYNVISMDIHLITKPDFNPLSDIAICRETETAVFDFSAYQSQVLTDLSNTAAFFESITDATANINPITNSNLYPLEVSPKTIFVRVDNGHCFEITSFALAFSDTPKFNLLPPLIACNQGLSKGTFDFSDYEETVKQNATDTVVFYDNLQDAATETNPLINTTNYVATTTPKEIFIRITNDNCFSLTSFMLATRNCPPTVYNYISANDDGVNDHFIIDGLKDIFLQYRIEIYSRWGRLIWTGDQNTDNWNGHIRDGFYTEKAPDGTYFYFLFLNDKDYPEPLKGFLYLNH